MMGMRDRFDLIGCLGGFLTIGMEKEKDLISYNMIKNDSIS